MEEKKKKKRKKNKKRKNNNKNGQKEACMRNEKKGYAQGNKDEKEHKRGAKNKE